MTCGPHQAKSERSQKIKNVLLLPGPQIVELLNDRIRLTTGATVRLDCHEQVAGPAVMHEKDPLTDAPQGCAPELIWARGALGNTVRQALAHVMHQQIGVEVDRLSGQRGT